MTIETLPNPRGGDFPAERAQDVTASVVAGLFGLSTWVSRWQLWQHHKNGAPLGNGNVRLTRAGKALEDAGARFVAEEENLAIEDAEVYLRDPDARLGASPDFWTADEAGKRAPLEHKNVSAEAWRFMWNEGRDPPLAYQLQLQVQIALCGADHGCLSALVAGHEPQVFWTPARPATFARVKAEVASFWASIEADEEPPVDYKRDSAAIKRILEGVDPEREVDLSASNRMAEVLPELARADRLLSGYRSAANGLDKLRAVYLAEVLHAIGDAGIARGHGFTLTSKLRKRKATQQAASQWREVKITADEESESHGS